MRNLEENPGRAAFYQNHLDRVSRSFAFCIARLEGTLRERVGLSYLLCRILDSIEDAEWPNFAAQRIAFDQFDKFLVSPPEKSSIDVWVAQFPAGLPPGELLLLKDAAEVLHDFHELPENLKTSLTHSILSMSAGMRHYMGQKAKSGRLVLESAADVNRYCFFVAGVVGEMLTRFIVREFHPSIARLKDGFRFGLFLQKVNLLKDQAGDEVQGRFLVPSRSAVLSSMKHDAEAAFRYLISLPEKDAGFRLFCAWSLFLGLASLPWIQGVGGGAGKIPREETMRLLNEVESRIHDDQALAMLFDQLKPVDVSQASKAGGESFRAIADEKDHELLRLYRGELPAQDVIGLFRENTDGALEIG